MNDIEGDGSRELHVLEQMLGKEYKIGHVMLRRPSMAAFGVLRAGKSALVSGLGKGVSLEDAPEMEMLKFVALLDERRTSKEAFKMAMNEDALLEETLAIGESMEYGDMGQLMEGITEYLNEATKMRVVPVAEEGKDAPPPKT